jgi:hypothetical protein
LRITAQLLEAETGAHLWADRYDGAVEDVFDLQDKITHGIVGIIEPNLRRAEIERAQRKRPDSLDAYDLYLRALPHMSSVMPEDAAIGMGYLEEALKLDPNYAAAHAYMAWALEMRFVRGGFSEADAATGVRHARAALAHGGDDATALAVASLTILHLGHDFDAASGAIARALLLNGSCATAYHFALSGDAPLAEDFAGNALPAQPVRSVQLYGLVRNRDRPTPPTAIRRSRVVLFESRAGEPSLQHALRSLHSSSGASWSRGGSKIGHGSTPGAGAELSPATFHGGFFPFFDKELAELLLAGFRKAALPE